MTIAKRLVYGVACASFWLGRKLQKMYFIARREDVDKLRECVNSGDEKVIGVKVAEAVTKKRAALWTTVETVSLL